MTERQRHSGLHLQRVEDPEEVALARQFNERLDGIQLLLARWAKVGGVQSKPGSELALDDEHSAWRHLSHTVNAGLNLATDNLRALLPMVRPHGGLQFPQFAHYSVLRGALEGSSLALWLLAPEDPRIRIQRLLRAAFAELEDDTALSNQILRGVTADPSRPFPNAMIDRLRKDNKGRRKKHLDQIKLVSHRLGLEDPSTDRWHVGYAEICRDATAATGVKDYYGETTWRLISGLTHPSLMRATSRSNVEEIADNGDGTLHALITTDIGLSTTALEAASLNTHTAIEILGSRKIRPGDRAAYVNTQPSTDKQG